MKDRELETRNKVGGFEVLFRVTNLNKILQ